MAYKEKCRGCINENKCDYISCILEKKRITLNATEEVRNLIYAALMSYGNSLSAMAKEVPNEPDIESKLIEKSKDAWFLARDIKECDLVDSKEKIVDFNIADFEEDVQQYINDWVLLQSKDKSLSEG